MSDDDITKEEMYTEDGDRIVDLNRFFNDLPVRILGTHTFPIFYAADITRALGISRAYNALRILDERHIVNESLKRRLGILSCRKNGRPCETVLINERGLYKLIYTSRSDLAERFQDFVDTVLYEVRVNGEYRVKLEKEELAIIKTQKTQIEQTLKLKEIEMIKIKTLLQVVWVFEIDNDPAKIIQRNLNSDDEDSVDTMEFEREDFEDENTIDDFMEYERFLKQHPHMRRNEHMYKLCNKPSPRDFNDYETKCKIYCHDSKEIINAARKKLAGYQVGKDDLNIFDCELTEVMRVLQECMPIANTPAEAADRMKKIIKPKVAISLMSMFQDA
jgi:prophage antirepressor-like protein